MQRSMSLDIIISDSGTERRCQSPLRPERRGDPQLSVTSSTPLQEPDADCIPSHSTGSTAPSRIEPGFIPSSDRVGWTVFSLLFHGRARPRATGKPPSTSSERYWPWQKRCSAWAKRRPRKEPCMPSISSRITGGALPHRPQCEAVRFRGHTGWSACALAQVLNPHSSLVTVKGYGPTGQSAFDDRYVATVSPGAGRFKDTCGRASSEHSWQNSSTG